MLKHYIPCLSWLGHYDHASLRGDLMSGLTIGFMLIPQGMAYAMVAGLPPQYGLYASIFPPLMYALLGTSNKVSPGPVALDAILIITGLSVLAEPGTERYLELALTLTLLVGAMQFLFGLLKLGFIVNFLSYPVIMGYTSAAAVIIIASQLEGLAGYSAEASTVFGVVWQLMSSIDSWSLLTLGVGLGSMLFIIALKKYWPKAPYAILLVSLGMLLSGLFGLSEQGVAVVAGIPEGLPDWSIPDLRLADISQLLTVAFSVALLGYIGSISISRSVEQPNDRFSVRPNQELIALGAANMLAAFVKGFPISGSFSRSAVFRESGAKTQLSAVFSSILLAVTLLFLTPLFDRFPLPKALLSAIIVMSVYKLIQYQKFRQLYSQSRREAGIMLGTFLLTLILGVQQGLLIGVIASVVMVIYNSSRPHMTELGLLEGDNVYRNIDRFDEAIIRDEVLIFRFDAMLYFSNADYCKEQLYRWIAMRDRERLRAVVFNAESVSSVDSTALLMLIQVVEGLRSQGVDFYMSNMIGPVRDRIQGSELVRYLPQSQMFATVEDAIAFYDEGIHRRLNIAAQWYPR